MVRPLLGFEKLQRFILIEREEFLPFLWMQSIEDPSVAFVIVNPSIFSSNYNIEINPNEIAEIQPTSPEFIETYVIANIPSDWENMTINLQGPILLNTLNNKGKQLVLLNSVYNMRESVLIGETSAIAIRSTLSKDPVGV
jgi:flagellar assembly factor FliW